MLKKTSNMDTGSQHDAITQLDDHIQHLKTLSDGIDEEAADLVGEGEDTPLAKNLFRQHDAVSLSTTTNELGPNEMISKNQAVPEVSPPLVSDAEPSEGRRGETTNGGKVPLLVLRQPALPEPELEKVWSDVDDDKNPAIPNDLGDPNAGDKSSASSSAATSSSNSDHDAMEPLEDKIASSENISNGNASESMEFEIPEQQLKDNDNDLFPQNVDFDEEKLSPAPRAQTVQPAEDPTAPTSEETAVASNSSSEGSSSDSSSDSDSDSSSDSGSSKTSHQSNLPTIGESSDSITAEISANVRESADAVRKVETRKDLQVSTQIGVNPIPTLGNRRRRKPLLSSKKKIII
ncbi:hypothetical protein MHU86_24882 [Fragilaria crotonensis]|nr:hypothetical protein MHU86_24882 [Fragilaria crotonensis]